MIRGNVSGDETTLIVGAWLKVSANGNLEISQDEPKPELNAVSVRLDLNIPRSMFKQPTFEASFAPTVDPRNTSGLDMSHLVRLQDRSPGNRNVLPLRGGVGA